MKSIISSILFVIALAVADEVKSTEIECDFSDISGNIYMCWMLRPIQVWHRKQNVIFTGNHLEGRTHQNVTGLMFPWDSLSTTPHVLSQAFRAFPNLRSYQTIRVELEEIVSGDFIDGENLENIAIDQNPLLTTIPARAFTGASNLKTITLRENAISTIHADAFQGINKLEHVSLYNNRLKVLPENIFKQHPFLRHFGMGFNLIETLSSQLFENNPKIEVLDFFGSRINAVERNFFDNFENPELLYFGENQCINGMFFVNDENPMEKILPEFETCFQNFDKIADETRTLTMELRGSLVIRDQDGEEIVRIDTRNESQSFGVIV